MTRLQTLIIGHRGASGSEPENTMRAFHAAHKANADGIELDIFQCRNKIIVVTHDIDTFRLTKQKYNVRKSTLSLLRSLDYGKNERIPTLEEVFETFLSKFKTINVEIKSTGLKSDGIEDNLAKLIRKFDCHKKILVSSFNPLNIYRIKQLLPEVRIGYLIEPKFSSASFHLRTIRWLKPNTLNLHPALLDHAATKTYFDLGIPLWMWAVDTKRDWEYWLKKRVQAIITDHPKSLRTCMKNLKISQAAPKL